MAKSFSNLSRLVAAFCAALGLWFGLMGNVFASSTFNDNFEWWTGSVPHALTAGDPWYYDVYAASCSLRQSTNIQNDAPYEGQRILSCWDNGSGTVYALQNGVSIDNGTYTFYANLYESHDAEIGFISFRNINTSNECGRISFRRTDANTANVDYMASDGYMYDLGNIDLGEWEYIGFEWDTSAYNAADRWVRYKINGTWSEKIYNPNSSYCLSDGVGSFYIAADTNSYGSSAEIAIDNIVGYDGATGGENSISITYPEDNSTSQATNWTIDATTATSTDSVSAWICYGTDPQCAGYSSVTDCMADENCVTDHKVLTACDDVAATYDGTSNITLFSTLTNTSTYYAKAFLFASDKVGGFCSSNGDAYLVATSSVIDFTYNSDYMEGLDDTDQFWASGWGGMWGAATSTPGYAYGKNMIDTVTKPILNIGAVWSSIFHPDQATNWGVTAGENIKTMLQKIGGFFNIIPDFQLFLVLFVAILVDLAIFFIRLFFKARSLMPK